VALFERTRIPDVLYLILIGVIIGPVLNIVTPQDFGKVGSVFTLVALVVILFEGGLELTIDHLRSSWRTTIIITLTSYLLGWVIMTVAVYYLADLTIPMSLFVGAVLAGPAPAVVIPLVRQLKISDSTRATMTLETPLGEALCIIVALSILDSLTLEHVQIGEVIGRLLSSFLVAILIGGIGGFAWSILLEKIRQLRHAIFTTPSFILVLFGVTESLGFSGAVAALTFGVTLGNVGTLRVPWLSRKFKLKPMVHNEVEKSFFGEIVFLIKTFFFVYLGLSVRLVGIEMFGLAVALSLLLFLSRLVAVWLATTRKTSTIRDASLMGTMIPKGTAAVVLASIPLQMGFIQGGTIQNVVYGVVVMSILLTALLVILLERGLLLPFLKPLFPGYPPGPETDEESSAKG